MLLPYQTFIHERVALGHQLHLSDVEKCSQMCLQFPIFGLLMMMIIFLTIWHPTQHSRYNNPSQ